MNVVAVVVGGLVGTGLRLGVDALLSHRIDEFPWSTLIVNLVGSFVLGALVARVWANAPEWLRLGLGTGMLGSFTTFSAVIASVLGLTTTGDAVSAALYVAVSVIGGLILAAAGLALGRRPVPQPAVDE